MKDKDFYAYGMGQGEKQCLSRLSQEYYWTSEGQVGQIDLSQINARKLIADQLLIHIGTKGQAGQAKKLHIFYLQKMC